MGLLTRSFRSSRKRDGGGSACSLDEGRPNLPSDIFAPMRDLRLFFFLAPLLSNVLFALLNVSSALNVFSSTTLVRDLFIKSSANDTFGLGSRLTDARELIDERNWWGDDESWRDSGVWFE